MEILDIKQTINAYKGLPVYNKSSKLFSTLLKDEAIIYGWHIDPSVSDPSDAITYLENAVDKKSAKMKNIRETVKGYRDLEYIQNTGTQGFITDIIPTYEDTITLNLNLMNNLEKDEVGILVGLLVGNADYSNPSEWYHIAAYKGIDNVNYGLFRLGNPVWSNAVMINYVTFVNSTPYNIISNRNKTCYWGNVSKLINYSVTLNQPTKGIGILGEHYINSDNNYSEFRSPCSIGVKLYSLTHTDISGNILHHLIPVERISDNALGLIDTITNTFYPNAGTGTFVKGNYISEEWFDYGDWENAFFMPKPCMLKSNGTVDYYLDENDYNKKKDYSLFRTIIEYTGDSYTSQKSQGWVAAYKMSTPFRQGRVSFFKCSPNKKYKFIKEGKTEWFVIGTLRNEPQVNSETLLYNLMQEVDAEADIQTIEYTTDSTAEYIWIDVAYNADGTFVSPTIYCYEQEDSDIANTSYDGNAMMEWPLIYYKFESLEDKGFKAVEYIKSTGTQTVITDIIPTYEDTLILEAKFDNFRTGNVGWKTGLTVVEANATPERPVQRIGLTHNSSSVADSYMGYDWNTGSNYEITGLNTSNKLTYTMKKNYFSVGTSSVTPSASSYFAEPTIPISIFGATNYDLTASATNTCDMYLYDYKIYDSNNNLIHNLIPVERISDNELGLYDTLTNKFYANSGTGTFVKGSYIDNYDGWFYCSNSRIDNTYHCWCNYDSQNNIIPHFYTAIYNGTGTSKMRSLSGIALTEANGNGVTTTQQEINRAIANNTTANIEWYTAVYSDRQLISALLILMGKTLDNQRTYGRGRVKIGASDAANKTFKESYVTGTLNDKGLFYGSLADEETAIKVFGMENWWGECWTRTAGLVGVNNKYMYKLTYNTADGSSASAYNLTGSNYLIGVNFPSTSGQNVKDMSFGNWGILPSVTISDPNYETYYCENVYSTQNGYALYGGSQSEGYAAGSSYLNIENSTSLTWYGISTFLSCKPIKTN